MNPVDIINAINLFFTLLGALAAGPEGFKSPERPTSPPAQVESWPLNAQ